MKEIKVYLDELPKSCTDCPCYDFDIGGCQCKDSHFTYDSINRFKGCPLIDIKTHDRVLVKDMLDKFRKFIRDNTYVCGGKATRDDLIFTKSYNKCLSDLGNFIDSLKKEFE